MTDSDESAIILQRNETNQYWLDSDVKGVTSGFTTDAIIMPSGMRQYIGHEQIGKFYSIAFAWMEENPSPLDGSNDLIHDPLEISGDIAIQRYFIRNTKTARYTRNALQVYKKRNGVWKLYRYIFTNIE